jgi:hypothetical protein
MADRDEMRGSSNGEYRFILETRIQYFGRKPEDHFGERQPMVGQFVTTWIGARSFFPPRDIRELPDLTRRRRTLVGEGAAERNRVQKVLEDANVKLGNVLSDVFGTSGQAILEALLENKQSPSEIAELGHWSLAPKIPQIIEALEGHRMSDHHRFLIRQSLRHMRYIEEMIEELDKEIAVRLKPYQQPLKLACTVPESSPIQPPASWQKREWTCVQKDRFQTAITWHRDRPSAPATMRAPASDGADEHARATDGCEQP